MDSKGREVWKQGAFSHYLAEEAGATGLVSVMLEAAGQVRCGQRQLCGRLDIHAKDVSL